MNSKLSVLFLFIFSGACYADEEQFECTITLVHAIAPDGQMVTDTDHLINQRGSKFTVDRASGTVTGGYFLDSDNSEKITVINEPSDNSYYAIYEETVQNSVSK